MPPGIDIVVVNHRTPRDLAACLTAITDHPPTCDSTLVVAHSAVEEADTDACVPSGMPIRQLLFDENVGYNVACNRAGALGELDSVAFLNADARPSAGAFDELRAALFANPARGIVGPRQVNSLGRITAGGILGTPNEPRLRGWQSFDCSDWCDTRDDAIYISGSFLLMRRSLFDELTECPIYRQFVPDEPGPWGDFHHYEGDAWLGYHARGHDQLCTYVGTVCCIHEWHRASALGGHGEQHQRPDHVRFQQMCKAHGLEHN